MKKIVSFMAVLLLAASCGKQASQNPSTQNNTRETAGVITSVTIEPSHKNANWTLYGNGAVVKVIGKNLQSVEVKYNPSGTSTSTQSLGQMTSLSSQADTWMLQLPRSLMATDIWAEAKDVNDNAVKSQGLGNVGYDQPNVQADTKNGYSIEYPKDFSFTATQGKPASYIPVCDDASVGCVYYSGNAYKGTNLEAAAVSVNILTAKKTEAQCYVFSDPTNEAQNANGTMTINGIQFKAATGGSAGAGHFKEVNAYRNFHNGKCYELAQNIASTNIANYEPGAIQEFNKNEVVASLQSIIQSFTFASGQSGTSNPVSAKLKICPDEWIEDRMPSPDRKPGDPYNAYFIINGQRKEIANYDLDWIKKNCPVNQPTIAY